jgi:PTH1 family peptidyl-tRNA hydrolase
MKLIVGLGNPEARHTGTRHNIGFDVVEQFASQFSTGFTTGKGKYLYAKCSYLVEPVILLKPMTYMNLSGHAVVAAMSFYKIGREELLVICDDLNLPLGTVRLRAKGSAGGQNGLKHIIHSLGSEEFARLRVGIGQQEPPASYSSFVLSKFAEEEKPVVEKVIPVCIEAALSFVSKGIEYAMNTCNRTAG